jgi:hypothetical protein
MIHLSPRQARRLEVQAGLSPFQRAALLVRELRPLWGRLTAAQRRDLLRRLEGAA